MSASINAVAGQVNRLPEGPFDAVLMDPPRMGSPGIAEALSGVDVPRLIYVSCDPATLGRDVKGLVNLGWSLELARPYDLFPYTGHMETVAVLNRGK